MKLSDEIRMTIGPYGEKSDPVAWIWANRADELEQEIVSMRDFVSKLYDEERICSWEIPKYLVKTK